MVADVKQIELGKQVRDFIMQLDKDLMFASDFKEALLDLGSPRGCAITMSTLWGSHLDPPSTIDQDQVCPDQSPKEHTRR